MTRSESTKTVLAGSGNRVVALLLDVGLLSLVVPTGAVAAPLNSYLFPLLFLLYFTAMPVSPLQGTLGKWVCRIKLCDLSGNRLTWRASAVRAGTTLGWFCLPWLFGAEMLGAQTSHALVQAWWLVFALPWAPVEFLPRRQSVFDLLAGSMVVRYQADVPGIRAVPLPSPGRLKMIAVVLFCLTAGTLLSQTIEMYRVRNLFSRIAYAIEETGELRQKVEAFHATERRWPTATDLGVPPATPYPDGGGYRLAANGSIVIFFSVLPELKGRNITLLPVPATGGSPIVWRCQPDAGLDKRALPHHCR